MIHLSPGKQAKERVLVITSQSASTDPNMVSSLGWSSQTIHRFYCYQFFTPNWVHLSTQNCGTIKMGTPTAQFRGLLFLTKEGEKLNF
jgi:hypothetical protein